MSTPHSKRLLLVANTGWYLRNFRSRLVESLEADGYELVLASAVDDDTHGAFFQKRDFRALNLSRKGMNPLRELAALWRLASLVREVKPVVILTWTPKPNLYLALVGRLLGVKVIPNVSGLGVVFIKEGLLARFLGRLFRFAFKPSPIVFFQNEEDKTSFVERGWVPAQKAERLPGSGVDLIRFSKKPLPEGRFIFLFVGRLIADKGVRLLVEAIGALREEGHDVELKLAGFLDEGNPAAITQSELSNWQEQGLVTFLGSLEDVRPALQSAHCVVLPSYYREGVPRSLLEAAASGRPIITTDAPGCRDALVADQSGYLCQPRDVDSLLNAMRRMLGLSDEQRAQMGQAGREHVEAHFAEKVVIDAYLHELALL